MSDSPSVNLISLGLVRSSHIPKKGKKLRISKFAKIATLALAFGLVAGTPAYAVDLQGSGASFPALLIEGCKAGFASNTSHTYV